jgi:mycoredoxin
MFVRRRPRDQFGGVDGAQMGQAPCMSHEPVLFYWRPGCGFCSGLRRHLDSAGVPLDERNIWDDPDAAAFVRSVARGYETVPTVVVGDRAMVNPRSAEVLEAVAEVSAPPS